MLGPLIFPALLFFLSFQNPWWKHWLPIENRVDIWLVWPQLSLGDTRKIGMWFEGSNRHFYTEVSLMEKLTNWALLTPIPGHTNLHLHTALNYNNADARATAFTSPITNARVNANVIMWWCNKLVLCVLCVSLSMQIWDDRSPLT